MANSEVQVQPDSTGKMIQTFANMIGGQSVHAQGIVQVDTTRTPVPEAPVATTSATNTQVAASVTSVSLLASNSSRKTASVFNDSATATLYLTYGATSATTAYKVQVSPGSYFEFPLPIYTGAVSGIWTAAVGNAVISEES